MARFESLATGMAGRYQLLTCFTRIRLRAGESGAHFGQFAAVLAPRARENQDGRTHSLNLSHTNLVFGSFFFLKSYIYQCHESIFLSDYSGVSYILYSPVTDFFWILIIVIGK